jgi:hypothetical protein
MCKIDLELEDAADRGGRGAGKVCGGTGTKKLKATEDHLGVSQARRAEPGV